MLLTTGVCKHLSRENAHLTFCCCVVFVHPHVLPYATGNTNALLTWRHASQDNILFGRPFNEALYWPILKACALQDDVDMLEAGDRTELGERGINLSGKVLTRSLEAASARMSQVHIDIGIDRQLHSTCRLHTVFMRCSVKPAGGQKARLALARAAYAAPDVALLDDPLSAVDPRVGRILFSQCIGPQGIMQGAALFAPLV